MALQTETTPHILGWLKILITGKISNRVLDRQDMPKNSTLSQDELNKFKYWVDNDYSEN